jgi:hypothetical protein
MNSDKAIIRILNQIVSRNLADLGFPDRNQILLMVKALAIISKTGEMRKKTIEISL